MLIVYSIAKKNTNKYIYIRMEEQNKKMQVNVSSNTGLPNLFSPINDKVYKVNLS